MGMRTRAMELAASAVAVAVAAWILTASGVLGGLAARPAVAPVFLLRLTIRSSRPAQRHAPTLLANGHSPAVIVLPAHRTVKLVITATGSGITAPVERPRGLVGGYELVNGMRTVAVAASAVSHVFAVARLGVHVVIPAAAWPQPQVVVAYFRTEGPGVYTWRYLDPYASPGAAQTAAGKLAVEG